MCGGREGGVCIVCATHLLHLSVGLGIIVHSAEQRNLSHVSSSYMYMHVQWRVCFAYQCVFTAIPFSVCLSICLLVCLSVCLPACLSVCLSACLSVCLLPSPLEGVGEQRYEKVEPYYGCDHKK